jgi:hypothetical protein
MSWYLRYLRIDSIFDQLIESNGYPFLNNKKEYVHSQTLNELMDKDSETLEISKRYTIPELEAILHRIAQADSKDSGLAIVEDGFLAGIECMLISRIHRLYRVRTRHPHCKRTQ